MSAPKSQQHSLNSLDLDLPQEEAEPKDPEVDMSGFAALQEDVDATGLGNPTVTFIFPWRWMEGEDLAYFPHNIYWQMKRQIGEATMGKLRRVLAYDVVVAYQYKTSKHDPLTKAQMQKIFEPIFPNGKLLSLSFEYTQARNQPDMLPLCDMRLFFEIP